MRKLLCCAAAALFLCSVTAADEPDNDGGRRNFPARLTGFEEVPAVSTAGQGAFRAELDVAGATLTYTLEYSDLQFDAAMSHIHFGQRGSSGGVVVWLCANPELAPPPASVAAATPRCPARSGTVTSDITAAKVVGPANQGIAAGEWAEFLAALRAGRMYVNVHSVGFRDGEIRGQVAPPRGRGIAGAPGKSGEGGNSGNGKGKGKGGN